MAENNQGHDTVHEWPSFNCQRGNTSKSRKTDSANVICRDDGTSGLSEQGRKEWSEEWSTVVPYYYRSERTGKEERGYYLVTILPHNKGAVKRVVHKYPATMMFLLIYIALVATITLALVRFK